MKSEDHFNFCHYLQCSNHLFCVAVVITSADCWQYFPNVSFKEAAGSNSRQSPAMCLGGGGTLLFGGNIVLVQLGSCTPAVLAVVENLGSLLWKRRDLLPLHTVHLQSSKAGWSQMSLSLLTTTWLMMILGRLWSCEKHQGNNTSHCTYTASLLPESDACFSI